MVERSAIEKAGALCEAWQSAACMLIVFMRVPTAASVQGNLGPIWP
jgi:hypothetical protein